jgi:hypothetical protein
MLTLYGNIRCHVKKPQITLTEDDGRYFTVFRPETAMLSEIEFRYKNITIFIHIEDLFCCKRKSLVVLYPGPCLEDINPHVWNVTSYFSDNFVKKDKFVDENVNIDVNSEFS